MKRKKITSLLLAGIMAGSAIFRGGVALTNAATVNSSADSTPGDPVTQDSSQACEVDASIASTFAVTVPKKITLDGGTKSGTYSVTCKGDIAGNEGVSVVPDADFAMSQTGKADVQAAVTQEKTVFRGSDYIGDLDDAVKMGSAAGDSTGTVIDGSIVAPGLSAGAWNGAFNFTIGLKKIVLDSLTLTDGNLSSYVDAETGDTIATSGDVVIPEVVKNKDTGKKYQVTGLNKVYRGNKNITSVSIPASVTDIQMNNTDGSDTSYDVCYAFAGCDNLKSISVDPGNEVYDSRENCNAIIETATNKLIRGCKNTAIPNSITGIAEGAFSECIGLTSVEIPDSVISIGESSFDACSDLTAISVDSKNTVYDSRENCNAIIETKTNKLVHGCKNTVIPNDVTSIGKRAFYNCLNLTSINIPGSVADIGENAFYSCSGLASIIVDSGNTVYDSRGDCNAIIETKTNKLIRGCKNTVIPNDVTGIGKRAFNGCLGLTTITIPNSVTSIEKRAFVWCTDLSSVKYNGQTYTSKSALTQALTDNNVTLEEDNDPALGKDIIFYNTALSD